MWEHATDVPGPICQPNNEWHIVKYVVIMWHIMGFLFNLRQIPMHVSIVYSVACKYASISGSIWKKGMACRAGQAFQEAVSAFKKGTNSVSGTQVQKLYTGV